MKNGRFVPAARFKSSPDVKSDGKAHVDTGKPTLTQQGIDVDEFIRDNHALIEKTQKGTTVKHEYTDDELAELKKIYDESGEAGLSRDEMRTLRKAGLLTNGLPAKPAAPSKRDIILAHCKTRIDQGQPVTGEETAEALGMSQKTVGNIIVQLRKEGLLPAFDKHSPRSKTRKTTTTEKKETMTNTAIQEQKPQPKPENPRAIIANALIGIYDSISALQRAAYHANDKVVYMFATKLLNGELMDIKANYSKDAK